MSRITLHLKELNGQLNVLLAIERTWKDTPDLIRIYTLTTKDDPAS